MSASPTFERAAPQAEPAERLAHLKEAVEHAAHLLPAQGPITVFIHHNTLHAFEDLPFAEAVKKAAPLFGCHPYLTEQQYRDKLRRGRISFGEVQAVLREDLGARADEPVAGLCSRLELRLAMLQYPLRYGPTEELLWFVAEKNGLNRIRDDASAAVRARLTAETRRWVMRDLRGASESAPVGQAELRALLRRFHESAIETWSEATWEAFTVQVLWRVCCDGVGLVLSFPPLPPPPPRHRDLLLAATGHDADLLVNDVLVRFCAAFLDQGLAHWVLPQRDEGFFRAFCGLYRAPAAAPQRWLKGLGQELARLEDAHVTPLEMIAESLDALGVPAEEWEAFLSATLLALRGWGGMLEQIERRGDRVVRPIPQGSVVEFLAIRLLLDRWALTATAREAFDYRGPLSGLRREARQRMGRAAPSAEQRAFSIFQLAQVLGWAPAELHRLPASGWASLIEDVEAFSVLERRRTLHLAFERRFYTQTLDTIALHAQQPPPTPPRPRFQLICCLDEREESLRRHVEEIAPDAATLGVAGFFNVAIYYRGAADAHFTPLCPVVIRPQHWVTEQVADELADSQRWVARTRRALGTASHRVHIGTRSVAQGALLSTALGHLATVPLVARILFPRLAARAKQFFGRVVRTPPRTRLQLERRDGAPGPEPGRVGFTLGEMAAAGERLLRDVGLTQGFARLVLLVGHGSRSLNNPHNSAYNCGACGGAAGGPNARSMAQILNDTRVRAELEHRAMAIPAATVFVGGFHNTCDDSVTFFDVEDVPDGHRAEFARAQAEVLAACARNAHERCRRFMSAPLDLSFAAAHEHVQARSEDLAQTRPECGHATNAICIVGRRDFTRGLFLDRRAFLTSYDPTRDDAGGTILLRVLQAVFPVCAGINLEYYFSYVDSTGWGCGTKLPHNVSGLLGVMDGAASDLRTGLPWQMVEIHEPVRLLFVIETTPEAMLRLIERDANIGRLCRNGWIQLAVLHPETRQISVYQGGEFQPHRTSTSVLPTASSSLDWYRGWREHLEFAAIPQVDSNR